MLLAIVLLALRFSYKWERAYELEELTERNEYRLEVLNRMVNRHFKQYLESARILAELPSLESYMEEPSEVKRQRVIKNLINFSVYLEGLAQVRILDAAGMEKVRIEAGGRVIPQSELQDKSARYYFTQGIAERRGSIYVSPLDLNVERGEVELPYRPTLRLAIPLDNSANERSGVLVVNFNGENLLREVAQFDRDLLWDVQLINGQGYWLINENAPEMTWGFMFPEGQANSLRERNPPLWSLINSPENSWMSESGEFYQWRRIAPYQQINDAIKYDASNSDYRWIILLHLEGTTMAGLMESLTKRYLIATAGLILLFLAGGFLLVLHFRYQSRLREVEAFHSQILSNAEVAVIATDVKGTIAYMNRAAVQLTGWESEELVGRANAISLNERFELEARARKFSEESGREISPDIELFAYAAERRGRYVHEWIFKRKDGSKLPVILAVSPLRDLKGRITGYMEVAVDITEQKRVQEALLAAKKEAEGLVKLKSQFLANMSHEIRTPMNGVIGLSNLLLATDLKPEQEQLAKTLVRSADVLMTVLNDILDFSKIEAGSLVIEDAPFDLHEVIDNTLTLFAPQAERKGVELINNTDPKIRGNLIGDSHRLTQVLSNLVGNAVKFTETGEVVVSVEVKARNEDGVRLRFEVKDTGIGMSEEVRSRIFTPFTQADASTTRKFGGTGLGLTISRNLVEMMEGRIGVESQAGKGSTFWIELYLPRDLDAEPPKGARQLKEMLEGKRAMVVDDNVTNLLVLNGQLSNLGMEVETFAAPKEAYRAYANRKGFDLIVLDYLMPEMDGVDLGRRLKPYREGSNSRCILLSSSQALIDQPTKDSAGIDAYMNKPISQRVLEQTLLSVFSQTRPAKEPAPFAEKPLPDGERQALRLILADDDETNRMVMELQLRKLGLRVDQAVDGEDLLRKLDESAYDVVFLDCNMPKLDGYEVARRLRAGETKGEFTASGHRLWLIAATAYAFEAEREKAAEVGMDDYISKPMRPGDLKEVLNRIPKDL